jgi:glycosyltransferase involved in cell wall biosynthesis
MIKAVFVMEQHLGHQSFYQNMRKFMDLSPRLEATWVKVTYSQPGHWIEKVPFLPKNLSGTLVGRSQVREALSRTKYDIALFNTQVPAVLGGSLTNRQPYIICTDITPIQYDKMGSDYGHIPDQNGLIQQYKQQVNTKLFQNAARNLPWSQWTANSLVKDYGVKERRIEVIHPGVDIDLWKPGKNPPCHPLRILFVGGDFYRKGGMLLVEACRQLPVGSIELVLVTKSTVPQDPWITTYHNMLPNSEDLIQLYRSCDVFVLPTNGEAFGIAAIEACSIGLPVIATRVGGLAEIVSDEETGYLISPGDQQGLVDRLTQLLDDCKLRRHLGQAARVRAEHCFNARKNVDRLIEILYENAVK